MTLDAATRTALMTLADLAEDRLGLSNSYIAIVLHRQDCRTTPPRYWLSIACDAHPELVRKMRSYFPARRSEFFRAAMGKRGDLILDGLSLMEIEAALAIANR